MQNTIKMLEVVNVTFLKKPSVYVEKEVNESIIPQLIGS